MLLLPGRVLSVTWSNDAERIFSGSSDGYVHVPPIVTCNENQYNVLITINVIFSSSAKLQLPDVCVFLTLLAPLPFPYLLFSGLFDAGMLVSGMRSIGLLQDLEV